MRLFRRQIVTLPLLSVLIRSSAAQRGGGGSEPESPNYPRRGEPLPNIPPLRRDLNGDRARNLKELGQLVRADCQGRSHGSWTREKLAVPLYLGAGSHTVRIVARTPGARIDRFELAPAPASVTPPRF